MGCIDGIITNLLLTPYCRIKLISSSGDLVAHPVVQGSLMAQEEIKVEKNMKPCTAMKQR